MNYFIARGATNLGEFSGEQILSQYNGGIFLPSDMFFNGDSQQWEELPSLLPSLSVPAPPPFVAPVASVTKKKGVSPFVAVMVIGFAIFGFYLAHNFLSFAGDADAKQAQDLQSEKIRYGGFSVERIEKDVEKHLREEDNIPVNSTVEFTSITPGTGKASAGILCRVLIPSQDTEKVVASFKGNSDGTVTITTSLDADKN